MSSLLHIKSWLVRQYKTKLNVEIDSSPSPSTVALWVQDDQRNASLFDADLGLWVKFIELEEAATIREHVDAAVQMALAQSSQLLVKSGLPKNAIDAAGAWTMTLVFLTPVQLRVGWEAAVQSLRSQSGFTEEISLDAIFYTDNTDLLRELDTGAAIPHLMFHSRSLLKLPVERLQAWSSADSEVAEMLDTLPSKFPNTVDRELVQRLVEAALNSHASQPIERAYIKPARRIERVAVRHMRNIADFDLVLREPRNEVVARIVHGPNGTGKSSIFEALSIAVAGSSRRLQDYLQDSDEGKVNSAQAYLAKALVPLDAIGQPSILADGFNVLENLPSDSKEAERRLLDADGTLLAQEDARLFVGRTGVELGAKILRDYSRLAQGLQKTCADEFNAANNQRQNWLRAFRINAGVRRDDSRLRNLVMHFLAEHFPQGSQQIPAWLQSVELRDGRRKLDARTLAASWRMVDEKPRREQLATSVEPWESLGEPDQCVRLIQQWVEERQLVVSRIELLRAQLADVCTEFAIQRTEIEADLKEWQSWALKPSAGQEVRKATEDADKEERRINERLSQLKTQGLAYAEQRQHIEQVQVGLMQSWVKIHPHDCPTCGADHKDDGGIAKVMADLAKQLDEKIVEARKQYGELLTQARAISQQRSTQGQCPLSGERRAELARMFGTDETGYQSLELSLRSPHYVDELLRSVDVLLVPPDLPQPLDASKAAKNVWDAIAAENAKGAALWELPERWTRIKSVIDRECDAIVKQHLPETLEAVWTELAMVMTPARWNLADSPRMVTGSSRTADSLRLVVGHGERIIGVRHIYNQAESHILGLSWFFTQYLSSGRAKHALMALDDPAQEMDQTTFRAFTRLLQTLCRLHERYSMPLTLVLLLHQEDRALDAARATNHQVTSLRWAKKISAHESVEQVILVSPDFKAPLPKDMQIVEKTTV